MGSLQVEAKKLSWTTLDQVTRSWFRPRSLIFKRMALSVDSPRSSAIRIAIFDFIDR